MKPEDLKEGEYYEILHDGKPLKQPYKYNGISEIRKGDHFFVNSNGLLRVAKERLPIWCEEGRIRPLTK